MAITKGYFGNDFSFEDRFFDDHERLAEEVERLKAQRLRIVLTMGSFDLFHIGHARYLQQAKGLGDVLIVGVDTDAKVRSRKKGDMRPVVPQDERYEMLAHTRYVDILTYKDADDDKWKLIKMLRPDVLQAVDGTYTDEQIAELEKLCGKVVIQKRQAATSTSAKIRKVMLSGMNDFAQQAIRFLPGKITELLEEKVQDMKSSFTDSLPSYINQLLEDSIREDD